MASTVTQQRIIIVKGVCYFQYCDAMEGRKFKCKEGRTKVNKRITGWGEPGWKKSRDRVGCSEQTSTTALRTTKKSCYPPISLQKLPIYVEDWCLTILTDRLEAFYMRGIYFCHMHLWDITGPKERWKMIKSLALHIAEVMHRDGIKVVCDVLDVYWAASVHSTTFGHDGVTDVCAVSLEQNKLVSVS